VWICEADGRNEKAKKEAAHAHRAPPSRGV